MKYRERLCTSLPLLKARAILFNFCSFVGVLMVRLIFSSWDLRALSFNLSIIITDIYKNYE